MANGGWEFSTASGKLQGKIDWSSSSNGSSANTSNITAILYARRVDGYTTTGQSWSGYVKVQGKDNSNQTNISFGHSVSVGGSWVEMARVTLYNAKHNDDGSGSATVSGSVTGPSGTGLSGITSSGSSGITLDKIARYTSITSFTVSKRDETSFTFNWQTADTIDYAWYSTNNGSNWTGVDVTDGTSGSFNVTGLSVGGTYNCKLRVRRKDSQLTTDSAVVSAKTNTAPTTQINSYTETTATVKWTSDGTSNHIWYSVDNGSWVDAGNVNATTGTYTVSGLSVNADHNIKTRVRKSNTSNTYDSSAAPFKTYNWPNCTSAPDFTIGNSVKLDFYNPLNRTMSIRMWSHVSQGFVTDTINITGTTYTFTPNENTLYSSIPNNTSSTYNIDVTYSGNKYVKTGGKYSINTTASKPTFTNNFGLKDTTVNDLTTAIGNNQILVQNVSNINLTIASANKMVANKSATPRDYSILFGNLNKSAITYTANDLDVNVGVITSTGNITATVVAYDSRGSNTPVTKSFNVIQYNAPRIDISGIQRLNNYETETHVKIAGTFDKVTVGNEDKNLIKLVRFRYKESTSQTWESWTEISMRAQGSGSYETNTVTLQLDNTKQFNFQIEVTDRAKTTTTNAILNVGEPLMFLYTNGKLELNANSEVAGTLAGALDVKSSDLAIKQTHATTGKAIGFGIGGGGTNRGCWDFVQGKWLWYDDDNNFIINKPTIVTGSIARNLASSGTISNTNIFTLNGSTDGLKLDYEASTSDVGVSKLYTVDDDNARLELGNNVSGTYTRACFIQNGQIKGSKGGMWIKDRDNALIRQGYVGNGTYAAAVGIGTLNGFWTIGNLSGSENLIFNYTTDTNYISGKNTSSAFTLSNSGNFSGNAANVTQKKSLSSINNIGYGTNNGYCVDVSAIAYWNGAYSGTASNLQYAAKGKIPRMRSSAQMIYKRQGYSGAAWAKTQMTVESSLLVGSDFAISGNTIKVNNANVNRIKVTASCNGLKMQSGNGCDMYVGVNVNGTSVDAIYTSGNSTVWRGGGSVTRIFSVANGNTIYMYAGSGDANKIEPLGPAVVVEDVSVW